MDPTTAQSEILLLHGGELRDVGRLFEEFGFSWEERASAESLTATSGSSGQRYALVVSTPQRLLWVQSDLAELAPGTAGPVRIAICEGDSRTLRSTLRRAHVDFLVRRPFHPLALRLLVLHVLYRGPERRHVARVSIGAPVRFRARWRRRDGVLAELSATGCRLLCAKSLPLHCKLVVHVPAADGRQTLGVRGRVVRVSPGEGPHPVALGIAFEERSDPARRRLARTLSRFAEGPAMVPSEVARNARGAQADASPDGRERSRSAPQPEPRPGAPASDEAAQKLIVVGRELSAAGMRIDAHPGLAIGDRIALALTPRADEQPLVVNARVAGETGDGELRLAFFDLQAEERGALGRLLEAPSILGVDPREHETHDGVVFAEILGEAELI